MAMHEWILSGLGVIGTLCFALMMVPQVVLNARRCSTDGLSMGLVVPWHVAGVLFAGVEAATTEPSLFSILAFLAMVFFCGVCEVQALTYRRVQLEGHAAKHLLLISVEALGMACSSGGVAVAVFFLTRTVSSEVGHLLGVVVPSVLLAVGFLPEFHEFVSNMSIEGYSFGVTAFDILGSSANTALYVVKDGASGALSSSAPFLTIIGMHILLLCLAVFISCRRGLPKGSITKEPISDSALP
jgi:hypothetical protein